MKPARSEMPPHCRWFAGSWGSPAGAGPEAVAALAGEGSPGATRTGPLALAWTGPPPGRSGPIACLLDGRIHNLHELTRALDLHVTAGPENPRDLLAAAEPENARDLRAAPGPENALGLRAAAGPDTVLAAAYGRFGEALLPRLCGEFVVVLWDVRDGSTVVARDQLGARPLHVHRTADRLIFASEVRQLLRLLPRRPGPDPSALAHWLAGGAPPGARTLYLGIERLEPGTFLRLRPGSIDRERFWSPRFHEPDPLSAREAIEVVRDGVGGAVARRLDGHDHVAIMLSGGLDSASLAALAAETGIRLTPCSAVFPDHPAVDESALIGLQRNRLGLPGIERAVRGGSPLSAALDFLAEWQLPLGPPGHFAWRPLVRAAAGSGATCILDGEGGDELFGAVPELLADRLRRGRPLAALALARAYPGAGHAPGPRFLLGMLRDFGVRPMLRPNAARLLSDGGEDTTRPEGPLWWRNLAHALTVAPEALGLFDYYRRRGHEAGAAAGHPFLDLELIETVLRLPPELAFDPLYTRPLLRDAVEGVVPDEVRLRRGKSYFDQLLAERLRHELPALRRLLQVPDAEVAAYVDRAALASLLADDAASNRRVAWTRDVWRLATAELWLRAQSDGPHPPFSDLDPGARTSSLGIRPCSRSRTLRWTT